MFFGYGCVLIRQILRSQYGNLAAVPWRCHVVMFSSGALEVSCSDVFHCQRLIGMENWAGNDWWLDFIKVHNNAKLSNIPTPLPGCWLPLLSCCYVTLSRCTTWVLPGSFLPLLYTCSYIQLIGQ